MHAFLPRSPLKTLTGEFPVPVLVALVLDRFDASS
jgi:hypothetical protein